MDPAKKDSDSIELPHLDVSDDASSVAGVALGVQTVEAAEKVYGKHTKWFLFLGHVLLHIGSVLQLTSVSTSLGLASYIYSLDGTTTYFYLPYATSEFDKHSLISTIQVAQAVVGTSFDVF